MVEISPKIALVKITKNLELLELVYEREQYKRGGMDSMCNEYYGEWRGMSLIKLEVDDSCKWSKTT